MTENSTPSRANISEGPRWTREQIQIGFGLEVKKGENIKNSLDQLSLESLAEFFRKHQDARFESSKTGDASKATPENSAAHIFAYQKALNTLLGTSLKLDGIYVTGGATYRAIRRFQQENGLTPNGQPSSETTKMLLEKIERFSDSKRNAAIHSILQKLQEKSPIKGISPKSFYFGKDGVSIEYALIFKKGKKEGEPDEYYAFDAPSKPGGPRMVYRLTLGLEVIGTCKVHADNTVSERWGESMNGVPYMPTPKK